MFADCWFVVGGGGRKEVGEKKKERERKRKRKRKRKGKRKEKMILLFISLPIGVVIKEMIDIYKERGEKHKTPKIIIDKDLGERGVDVRRCEREVWGEGKEGDGRIQYLTKEKELEILREWSGGEIKEIEKERGEGPRGGEEAREGTERFMKRLREIKEKESQKGKKVLVVGHGDMVDGGVRAFLNEVVYIAEECCWVGLGVDEEGEVEKVGGEGFESMVL